MELAEGLAARGYLGANHDPAVQTIWSTPKLLERIQSRGYQHFTDVPTIP